MFAFIGRVISFTPDAGLYALLKALYKSCYALCLPFKDRLSPRQFQGSVARNAGYPLLYRLYGKSILLKLRGGDLIEKPLWPENKKAIGINLSLK